MKPADALQMFREIASRRVPTYEPGTTRVTDGRPVVRYENGAAVEWLTHARTALKRLCEKAGLQYTEPGSISKYDDAIARARTTGTEVYGKTDSKSVKSWGGLRNDAAHSPTTFDASSDRVPTMIGGVREFISRTST